jgi:S-adenosylmethionine synthetase
MRFISWPLGAREPLIVRIYIRQNEKRKDKEVTARIERILKLRDQAIKGVDMGARTMFILCALYW